MDERDKELPKLVIPYYPDGVEDKGHYTVESFEEKLVSDYTGYRFNEIDEMDVVKFWIYLKDAFIYNMKQSEEGRKYLDNAWRLTQTNPDRDKLRAKYGKDGK